MIGPPVEFLIYFGARFVPCMRKMPNIDAKESLPCLAYSTSDSNKYQQNQLCSIADLCGLDDPENPNQSYRFVSAIFVHAGIVRMLRLTDILFNLVVLLTLCCEIEKLIGTPAYVVVFMAGGIGGNLLGGNFGLIGQPALGVSGAVYTCISFEIVDLLYNRAYVSLILTRNLELSPEWSYQLLCHLLVLRSVCCLALTIFRILAASVSEFSAGWYLRLRFIRQKPTSWHAGSSALLAWVLLWHILRLLDSTFTITRIRPKPANGAVTCRVFLCLALVVELALQLRNRTLTSIMYIIVATTTKRSVRVTRTKIHITSSRKSIMLQNQPCWRRAMLRIRENVFPSNAEPFEKRSESEFISAIESRASTPMPVEICKQPTYIF